MTELRNTWALREVYFDDDGNPSMHREPVPMTREQAMVIVQSNPDTMTAIRMAEAHHHITAQVKKETP